MSDSTPDAVGARCPSCMAEGALGIVRVAEPPTWGFCARCGLQWMSRVAWEDAVKRSRAGPVPAFGEALRKAAEATMRPTLEERLVRAVAAMMAAGRRRDEETAAEYEARLVALGLAAVKP